MQKFAMSAFFVGGGLGNIQKYLTFRRTGDIKRFFSEWFWFWYCDLYIPSSFTIFFLTFYDMRLSFVSRVHLAESLSSMRDDNSSAKYSVQYLRPSVRGVILNISARERIPPEYARAVLAGCLKLGALKTVVFTIPTKDRGLRIQSSDILFGEPGVGKGHAFQ